MEDRARMEDREVETFELSLGIPCIWCLGQPERRHVNFGMDKVRDYWCQRCGGSGVESTVKDQPYDRIDIQWEPPWKTIL